MDILAVSWEADFALHGICLPVTICTRAVSASMPESASGLVLPAGQ